ncbi:agmatinase [bacterium]|nr:agmatinase [bacterium]
MEHPLFPPDFDPNGLAVSDGLFGLPIAPEQSKLVIVPVPWAATVSYREGAAESIPSLVQASWQVDLYDPIYPSGWKNGIALLPVDGELEAKGIKARQQALKHLERLSSGKKPAESLEKTNKACQFMVDRVYELCATELDRGKKVGLLGGDHSTPLGLIRALAERHEHFGILQIDAHFDLRKAFEGFVYSHASIMHNALELPQVHKLVQVGIRDYCDEELEKVRTEGDRIRAWYDRDLRQKMFEGAQFSSLVDAIVRDLPDKVYVSFDIDGLDPSLCPRTGTPVPGGLQWNEALYLLEAVHQSGRTLIGFDLNEVVAQTGEDWDAMVGARLLYRLSNLLLRNG